MVINILLAALLWAGLSAVLFISTFLFYLSILKLRDVLYSGDFEHVHSTVRWTSYSIVVIGLILDVMLNWFFLTVTYLEFPRELLATTRIMRFKNQDTGWRNAQSLWWCKHWLSPFDRNHCGSRLRDQVAHERKNNE